MQLAVIAPVSHIWLSNLGDIGFLLVHRILNHPEVVEFWRKYPGFKLLDNSVFELEKPCPVDEIMEAARLVEATEIVLPDFPGDEVETFRASKEFMECLSVSERLKYKFMYVLQGTTPKELDLAIEHAKELQVNTVGFSILTFWKFQGLFHKRRPEVVHYCVPRLPGMSYHLLGLDDPFELYAYKGLRIRSVDTSLPCSMAKMDFELNGNSALSYFPPKHKRINEIKETFTPYQLALIRRSVKWLKQICRSV